MRYIVRIAAALLCLGGRTALAVDAVVDLGYAKYEGRPLPLGVTQWLGVRFAAPPLGELRFAAPEPPVKSGVDVEDATKFKPICLPRSPSDFTMEPNDRFTVDEDCLYLNVFAPSGATEYSKLPVMYFIQGGGFSSNSNANFNASDLAKFGDMIVVQVNYRVGPYGFLQSREVEAGASLNNGIKDQIQGLKWAKEHIAKFGGDGDHVVIVGDSTGATSVAILLTAFDSDPALFRGGIMESPSVPTVRTLEQGQEMYDCLTNKTGCDSGKDSLACLRRLEAAALQTEECWFNPNLDDDLIKRPTLESFAQGAHLKLPTIVGHCTDDGTKSVSKSTDTAEAALAAMNNAAAGALSNSSLELLRRVYVDQPAPVFPDSGRLWRQLAIAHTDYRQFCVGAAIQDALSAGGSPTYGYRFGPRDEEQEALGFGAYHTVEMYAVFGPRNTDGDPPESYLTANAPVVGTTMAYWASFVRSLDPNVGREDGAPEWKAWGGAESRERLHIKTGETGMEGMPEEQRKRCAMLGPMLPALESILPKGSVELEDLGLQAMRSG